MDPLAAEALDWGEERTGRYVEEPLRIDFIEATLRPLASVQTSNIPRCQFIGPRRWVLLWPSRLTTGQAAALIFSQIW
jgi:hypothetical protein